MNGGSVAYNRGARHYRWAGGVLLAKRKGVRWRMGKRWHRGNNNCDETGVERETYKEAPVFAPGFKGRTTLRPNALPPQREQAQKKLRATTGGSGERRWPDTDGNEAADANSSEQNAGDCLGGACTRITAEVQWR